MWKKGAGGGVALGQWASVRQPLWGHGKWGELGRVSIKFPARSQKLTPPSLDSAIQRTPYALEKRGERLENSENAQLG